MRPLALLSALLALLLVPAAQAELEVEVALDVATVRPGLTTANATVSVTLDCAMALARNGGVALGDTVDVAIAQSGAAAIRWSGPAEIQVPTGPCADPANPGVMAVGALAIYTVGLEGNLPAMAPQGGTVTASIPAVADPALPAAAAQDTFEVAAAPTPIVSVDVPVRIVRVAEAQQATVAMTLKNLGNVAVTVEARLASRGNYTIAGTPAFEPVEVASGQSAQAALAFFRPTDDTWVQQYVTLELTPVSKLGDNRGPTLLVEVLFQGPEDEGGGEPAPAPIAPLLTVALLGLAAATRRRGA